MTPTAPAPPAAWPADGAGLLAPSISYAQGAALAVTPDLLGRPTPCREWDLRMLLRHASESVAAIGEGPEAGRVGLVPDAEDPDLAADPARAFRQRAGRLLDAWTGPGRQRQVIDIAGCPLAAGVLAAAAALEIAVHGWDISRACGQRRPLPLTLAAGLLAIAPVLVPPAGRGPLFPAPVTVASAAGPGDRLAAGWPVHHRPGPAHLYIRVRDARRHVRCRPALARRRGSRRAGSLHLGPPAPGRMPDPETWIARFASLPLLAQPGGRWLYQTGSQVLSVLAARAEGTPFADVLRDRVLAPLGMHDTGFAASDTARMATCYLRRGDGWEVYDRPDGEWSRPPAFADGAGGLVSTVDDVLRFGRMLLDGGAGVLAPATVAAMTSDQLTPAQHGAAWPGYSFLDDRGWGYGVSVLPDGSYSWDGGLGTAWSNVPSQDMCVVVLTQRFVDEAGPAPVCEEVLRAARSELPLE